MYLQPLVEELEWLWIGVLAIDVTRLEGFQRFPLRGICIWSIHDYPMYGLFPQCQVQGYMACPLCGLDMGTR